MNNIIERTKYTGEDIAYSSKELIFKPSSEIDVNFEQDQFCYSEEALFVAWAFPKKEVKRQDNSDLNGSWPTTKEFQGRASDSCIEFCNSLGLIDDLRNCLNQLEKRTFSNIKYLFAELDYFQDEDTEDQGHIVFNVEVQSSRDVSKAEHNKWIDWFIENITDDKRQFFVLDLVRI